MFCFYKETDLFKINYRFLQTTVLLGYLSCLCLFPELKVNVFTALKQWTDRGRQRLLAQREHTDSTCCHRAVRNTGKERYTHHKETFRERFWPRSAYPNLIWVTDRHAWKTCTTLLYSTQMNDLNSVALLSESVWWCSATWRAGELVFTNTSMNNVPSYQVVQ